jgi:hypothetical protein
MSLRCSRAVDYSTQSRFTASALPPRHAVRREKPSLRETRRPPGKAAEPRPQAPKPRPRRSKYNIRASKRNPARAQSGRPPWEATAGERRWPQSRLAVVLEWPQAGEPARPLAAARGRDKSLPSAAGPHTPVARGPHSRPRPIRPTRPARQQNRISFSYTILIAKFRQSSTPKMQAIVWTSAGYLEKLRLSN